MLIDVRSPAPKQPHRSTPALEALIQRRTRKATQQLPNTPSPPPSLPPATKLDPSLSSYSPTSLPHLLSRLATFRLATYPPPKPRSLSPPAMALAGWCNQGGKDRVICGSCGKSWVVPSPSATSGGWKSEAGRLLEAKVVASVVEGHDRACPWRTRPCQPSLYRLTWTGPKGAAEDVLERARGIEDSGIYEADEASDNDPDLATRHPLGADDLEGLSAASTLVLRQQRSRVPQVHTRLASRLQTPDPGTPSEVAIVPPPTSALVLALFGWTVESSSPPAKYAASTRAPSTFRGSVAPPASQRGSVIPHSPTKPSGAGHAPASDVILSCTLCLRRVGAWSFLQQSGPATPEPTKVFDAAGEHRDFCPYVDPFCGLLAPAGTDVFDPPKPGWQILKALVLRYASPGRVESLEEAVRRAGAGEAGQSPAEKHRKVVGYVRGLLSGR